MVNLDDTHFIFLGMLKLLNIGVKVVNSDNIIIKKLYEQGLRDCENGVHKPTRQTETKALLKALNE